MRSVCHSATSSPMRREWVRGGVPRSQAAAVANGGPLFKGLSSSGEGLVTG